MLDVREVRLSEARRMWPLVLATASPRVYAADRLMFPDVVAVRSTLLILPFFTETFPDVLASASSLSVLITAISTRPEVEASNSALSEHVS